MAALTAVHTLVSTKKSGSVSHHPLTDRVDRHTVSLLQNSALSDGDVLLVAQFKVQSMKRASGLPLIVTSTSCQVLKYAFVRQLETTMLM